MKHLPTLTHLQFLVIGLLLETPSSGRDLRSRLRAHGARKSGPAFYQLMARLEESGVVDGRYEQVIVDGQPVRERHYRVAPAGKRAWHATREFYAEVGLRLTPTVALSHA